MTNFSYQQFLVKAQVREGIILYNGDRPIAILLDAEAKLVRFVLEAVGITARDFPLITEESALALIEKVAKKNTSENASLLPLLAYPPEILRNYFVKD